MSNWQNSQTVFIVLLSILILNKIISIASLIEDGALLRKVIPAVS
jgi:hypothetical protein